MSDTAQPGEERRHGEGAELGPGDVDARGRGGTLVGSHGQPAQAGAVPAQVDDRRGSQGQDHEARRTRTRAGSCRRRWRRCPTSRPNRYGRGAEDPACAAREAGAGQHQLLDRDRHGERGDGQAHAPHPGGGPADDHAERPWPAARRPARARPGTGRACSARRMDGEPGHAGEGQLGQRDLPAEAGEHHDRQGEEGEHHRDDQRVAVAATPNVSSPTLASADERHRPRGDVAGLGRRRAAGARPSRRGPAGHRRATTSTPMISTTGTTCWMPVVGSQSGIHVVSGRTDQPSTSDCTMPMAEPGAGGDARTTRARRAARRRAPGRPAAWWWSG